MASKAITVKKTVSQENNSQDIIPRALSKVCISAEIRKPTILTHYRRTIDGSASRILSILVYHVQNSDPDKDGFYWINISTIKALLNWNSNNNEPIYKALTDLKQNDIIWNIFGTDQTVPSGEMHCSVLQTLIINKESRTGIIGFQFSSPLIPVLQRPGIYGRQKVVMIALLAKPVFAFPIYEICTDAISRGENPFVITLCELFGYLDLSPESSYCKQYKDFKRYVLSPSVKKVNDTSDINVEFTPIKTGRKVEAIRFDVWKKECWQEFLPFKLTEETVKALQQAYPKALHASSILEKKYIEQQTTSKHDRIFNTLSNIGVKKSVIERSFSLYGADGIYEIYDYFSSQIKKREAEIHDKAAYLASLLNDGIGVKSSKEREENKNKEKKKNLLLRKNKILTDLNEIKKKAKKERQIAERELIEKLTKRDINNFKKQFESDYSEGLLLSIEMEAFSKGGWDNPIMETVLNAYICQRELKNERFFIEYVASNEKIDLIEIENELKLITDEIHIEKSFVS